jgi:mannosyltransferase
MATIASRRPAWSTPASVAGRLPMLAPVAFVALLAFSVFLRTRDFDVGYWIDEGLSIGIADRPLTEIPGALRLDGSPPLYYGLLHVWMAVFGRSEPATHALSLVFAIAAVPACWWAARGLFGTTAGWMGALLAATNPFLTQFAQETRMYALVMLLGLLATGAFLRAYALTATEEAPDRAARRRWAIAFALAFALMLYTHNWALFFGLGCGAAWLGLIATAPSGARRELLTDGLIGFGGALLLYAPWLPTFVFQAQHTGAPWATPPGLDDLIGVPRRLLGTMAHVGVLLVAGAGIVPLLARSAGRLSPRGRLVATLLAIWLVTVVGAWLTSQVSPAWASRYLSVAVPPLLLLVAAGLAYTGRLGLIAALVIAIVWAGDGAPTEKSNVREISEVVGPSLRPGDLVVVTQPEQVPVLAFYLPEGLRYATLWGPVEDAGVTDWRDGVKRMRGTTPERYLEPLLDDLPTGSRVVLMEPVISNIGRWLAPWTELVRVRSTEWRQFISNDPRFVATAVRPVEDLPGNHYMRATVLVKEEAR